MNNDEMIRRIERETRQLIGDQAIQIIVLRTALEMSKPFPKGPIPPQPDVEDHPPMDWPDGKPWPPEKRDDPDPKIEMPLHPEGQHPDRRAPPQHARKAMNGSRP
jgi:hypothetical protein